MVWLDPWGVLVGAKSARQQSHHCPRPPPPPLLHLLQVKQSALLRYAYLAAFLRHYSPDIYAEVLHAALCMLCALCCAVCAALCPSMCVKGRG